MVFDISSSSVCYCQCTWVREIMKSNSIELLKLNSSIYTNMLFVTQITNHNKSNNLLSKELTNLDYIITYPL